MGGGGGGGRGCSTSTSRALCHLGPSSIKNKCVVTCFVLQGDERLTTVRPLSPMYKVAPMFLAGTGSESRHGAASPPRLRSAGQRRPPSNMGLRRSTLGHHVSGKQGL